MKKQIVLALLFVLLASSTLTMNSGCKSASAKNKENVDLYADISRVHTWDADQHSNFAVLATLPHDSIRGYLIKHWPTLSEDVITFQRNSGRLKPGEIVDTPLHFFYVKDSTEARAQDSAGIVHHGFIKNQLVARMYFKNGNPKPRDIIVQCSNGMSELYGELNFKTFTMPHVVFTITKPNEDIQSHIGTDAAVRYGEHVGLPVFTVNEDGFKKDISYRAAKRLVNYNPHHLRIVIPVHVGDVCDITYGAYTCPH